MFVQVIQGQTEDPEAIRAALDRWIADLSPGATGFLGSTSGVTDDGTSITLARFDSEESARKKRPSRARCLVGGDGNPLQRRSHL